MTQPNPAVHPGTFLAVGACMTSASIIRRTAQLVPGLLCILCLALPLIPVKLFACWVEGQTSLERQMAAASVWGLIKVTGISYSNSAEEGVRTQVEFYFVNPKGKAVGRPQTLSYEGGELPDGDFVDVSTSPEMRVDAYYVVLLRQGRSGLEPVFGDPSVLPALPPEKDAISPDIPVRVEEFHELKLPDKEPPSRTAKLQQVLQALQEIEVRQNQAKGNAP